MCTLYLNIYEELPETWSGIDNPKILQFPDHHVFYWNKNFWWNRRMYFPPLEQWYKSHDLHQIYPSCKRTDNIHRPKAPNQAKDEEGAR